MSDEQKLQPGDAGVPLESENMLAEGRGFQPPSQLNPKEERESQTARIITLTLLIMLGVTFVTEVVSMIVLTRYNRLDAAPYFERMFAVWLPLLSGLVGSAITFYLTKDRK
jgi:hypothetical protein